MPTRQINGRTYEEVAVTSATPLEVDLTDTSVEISNDSGNPIAVSDAGGSITVDGPLTDAQLRASAVPVAPNVQQGGGAITASTTRVTLATDGPGVAALSSLDTKTPALQSGATPVGDNGSSLTVDGKAYRAVVSITRPSNTTTYAAGDVIGIADVGTPANAGSAIHTLTSVGPSGGYVVIQSVELFIGATAVPSGMGAFRLHLYTSSPTAILDNAVFDLTSGEVAGYVGYVDLPAPQDFGSTLYTQADYPGRLIQLAAASTSLYAELQTIGGYQPASGTVHTLRVKTLEAGL